MLPAFEGHSPDGQKAEVSLSTAKALRADGYMLRDRA